MLQINRTRLRKMILEAAAKTSKPITEEYYKARTLVLNSPAIRRLDKRIKRLQKERDRLEASLTKRHEGPTQTRLRLIAVTREDLLRELELTTTEGELEMWKKRARKFCGT